MKWAPKSSVAGVVTLAFVALVSAGLFAQTARTADVAFKAAQHIEEVEGDLPGAIDAYAKLAQGSDRAIAAQALVRMAACYDKLGSAEARTIYEQVVNDYADQPEQVTTAKAKLAAMRLSAESTVARTTAQTRTLRELMRSSELSPGEVARPTGDALFAVSGDGQLFIYTDWGTGDLALMNLATGEKRGLYGIQWGQSSEWVGSPVLSADDKKVAHVSYPETNSGKLRIDVDSVEGGHRETVFEFEEGIGFLTAHDWHPDGQQILISGQGEDRSAFLATVHLEDKTLRRLVTLDWETPRRAEYSPDGHFIAYDSTKRGDKKIYLLSSDGAQERVLIDSPGEDDSPVWTRDGRFLLFRSDRSGRWDLYALPMQNGQPAGDEVLVKPNLGAATSLRGVTDEGHLVYLELMGGRDVAITERITTPTQTERVRILPKIGVTENRSPAFTPDGKRVAYLASTPVGTRPTQTIRITDLDGTILKDIPLERRFYTNSPPTFSPDGKRLWLGIYDASLGEQKMMVLSAETGAVLKLFSPLDEPGPNRGRFTYLGWSGDSQRVYVARFEDGTRSLALIDVETERVIESTVLPAECLRFSLSPSGEALLMLCAPDLSGGGERTTRLVLRSLVDGSEKLLTEEASFRFGWDFDSRHVLYMKGEWGADENRLYSLSLDTLEETVLVEDMKDLGFPTSVSPDGQYWASEKQNGQGARILVLENFLPERAEQTVSR